MVHRPAAPEKDSKVLKPDEKTVLGTRVSTKSALENSITIRNFLEERYPITKLEKHGSLITLAIENKGPSILTSFATTIYPELCSLLGLPATQKNTFVLELSNRLKDMEVGFIAPKVTLLRAIEQALATLSS